MKVSYSIFIYLICLFVVSHLYAQLDMPDSKINVDKYITKLSSTNMHNQDWEVVFNYDISSISGNTGNAGVVYVSDWVEIWTSQWFNNVIDIWDVTDSSISLEYTNQQVFGVVGIRGMEVD